MASVATPALAVTEIGTPATITFTSLPGTPPATPTCAFTVPTAPVDLTPSPYDTSFGTITKLTALNTEFTVTGTSIAKISIDMSDQLMRTDAGDNEKPAITMTKNEFTMSPLTDGTEWTVTDDAFDDVAVLDMTSSPRDFTDEKMNISMHEIQVTGGEYVWDDKYSNTLTVSCYSN